MTKDIKQIKEQAIKLERYITKYITRECNVSDALGKTGCNMLSKLFEDIYNLEKEDEHNK